MKNDKQLWRKRLRKQYEGGENNMKLSVKNFGPIAKAENIEIRPLTVFVGPSNTGKSYLAILIYALLKSLQLESRIHSFFPILRTQKLPSIPKTTEILHLMDKMFEEDAEEIEFSEFPEEFQKWANKEVANVINDNFHEEAARCMGESSEENRVITKEFSLHFEDDNKSLSLSSKDGPYSANLKDLAIDSLRYRIKFSRFAKHLSTKVRQGKTRQEEELARFFYSRLLDSVFSMDMSKSFYLPAARTGIMQSHRAIAGALVQRATYAGMETVSVPTLSGIVSDFLEQIILMNPQKVGDSRIEKVAGKMEKEILRGSIKSELSGANQYPRFLYQQNGLEVPLLRSSSMVSELAPIVLFIRHKVEKGDLLIIEEPEAHLHPEAQRKIARVVARLVRVGVRVMVTTHSDYFLDQLANCVRLSKLSGVRRRTPFLEETEIGAYAFSQRKGRTIVKRLDFDKENGLAPEDHDKISSELYNETVDILEKLDQIEH